MKPTLLLFLFAVALFATDTTELHVTIPNVKVEQGGVLHIALATKETWKKPENTPPSLARKVAVTDSSSFTVVFTLPTPTEPIVIKVLHDANSNDKIDMRIFPFPKPKEGAGFSNNYVPSGPPKFKKAAITLPTGVVKKSIALEYPKEK